MAVTQKFTNSPLVSYTKLSPNYDKRKQNIDNIAIHCAVGQLSVRALGSIFALPSKAASSNYGIGYDGKIGMYVEEKNRSWCTSSSKVDHRAVTIEVACDPTYPYAVNDIVYESLIKLVADICKRNNIKKLLWKADKSLFGHVDKQNMVVHRWFSKRKSCPGKYLYDRHYDIANRVNILLDSETVEVKENTTFKVNDIVTISSDAMYYNGKASVPDWVITKEWYLVQVSGDRAVLGKSTDGKNNLDSAINTKYLKKKATEVSVPTQNSFTYYYIKRGDTLSTIAAKYKTTVSAIATANNIKNINVITVNQKLKIPIR